MNIKYIISASILALIGFAMPCLSQVIPLDPLVRTGKLANGFTYYIRHNEEPKNRVQLYLVNNVGSVLEDDDQQGLAHFMEHMNFNGTKNFPKNELINYLQKAGVRFGADLNAHTGPDETVYQLPVSTDDPILLMNSLKIMRDWAQEAILDSIEIDKERGVILEEERLTKGAKERMARQYYPMMLNHSRYASRLPIGLDDILTNFKPAVIKRFHLDWYRPDLQALIVVGDVDVADVERMIKLSFADLKMPAVIRPRVVYTVPLKGENQFLAVTDKEMPAARLEIMFKRSMPGLKTEADYLHMMKLSLLKEMLVSRRYMEISRQNNPDYVNMGMSIQPLLGGTEAFVFNVEAKEGKLKNAFLQSWTFIERIKRFGFTADELEKAKQNYMHNSSRLLAEKDKTPSVDFVKGYQELYLHGRAAPGIDWENAFAHQHIAEIVLEDINVMCKGYLQNADRDILLLAREKDKDSLPDSTMITGWMTTLGKQNLLPFRDEKVAAGLIPVQPVPGRVVVRKSIPEIGVTLLTLSNGLKVVLKPTDFKNDQIIFRGFSSGGTSLYNDADYDNAAYAAALTSRFGLGNFNPAQLSQLLNAKVLNVTADITSRSEVINGSSSVADLETALQVAHLQFTHPRKDSVIFKNTVSSFKDGLRGRSVDPASIFSDTISYVMGNYNYRSSPPAAEKLDKLNPDKIYAIYKDRFADASGFTFVFAGNFKIDTIIPLLEKYLGSLSALNRNEKARDLGIHIPEGQLLKTIHKGAAHKATVKIVYSGNYKYSPENNQLLNALGEVLQFKVLQHLREAESEVYAPQVQTSFVKYPKNRFAIIISFGCAPEHTDHLIDAVAQEIDVLRQQGISIDDIQKYKAAYSKNVELALKDNSYWLNYLVDQYENRENVLEILNIKKTLEKVTPENLKRATAVFFQADNRIRFILLPDK